MPVLHYYLEEGDNLNDDTRLSKLWLTEALTDQKPVEVGFIFVCVKEFKLTRMVVVFNYHEHYQEKILKYQPVSLEKSQ